MSSKAHLLTSKLVVLGDGENIKCIRPPENSLVIRGMLFKVMVESLDFMIPHTTQACGE